MGCFYSNRSFPIPPRSQFQYHFPTAHFKFPDDTDWAGPFVFDDTLKAGPLTVRIFFLKIYVFSEKKTEEAKIFTKNCALRDNRMFSLLEKASASWKWL
jgi:hypothetical protein